MNTTKFWMVLGCGIPIVRHNDKQSARTEAERLARAYPGSEFVVLESLASVVKSDISWALHDAVDETLPYCDGGIPF